MLSLAGAGMLLVSLSACEKEDTIDPKSKAYINGWIEDVMQEVYYWEDELPANPDNSLDPTDFFYSLLSDEDRFSYITPDYQGLINSLSGVNTSAGYEYAIFLADEGSNDVIFIVEYIIPNTPASKAGLQRGDVISKVNGTQITVDNYRSVINATSTQHTVDYGRYNLSTEQVEPQPTITLSTQVVSEDPNYLDSVYTVDGQKIGYYVYNFFSPGVGNSTAYDQQMNNIIAGFKADGVNNLILDLRYNGGGSVSSSVNLASLIGAGVSSSDLFFTQQWNDLYMDYFAGLSDGDEYTMANFVEKSSNIGSQLNGNTAYILTGSGSASASELVINGLKPYMNVVLVGDTTVGKNVGSVPIEDTNQPGNTYGLLPIVFKIFNSNGNSDYGNGFKPDYLVNDYQFPMYKLGDTRENLLGFTIQLITGSARLAQTESRTITGKQLGSSQQRKANYGRTILDENSFPFK